MLHSTNASQLPLPGFTPPFSLATTLGGRIAELTTLTGKERDDAMHVLLSDALDDRHPVSIIRTLAAVYDNSFQPQRREDPILQRAMNFFDEELQPGKAQRAITAEAILAGAIGSTRPWKNPLLQSSYLKLRLIDIYTKQGGDLQFTQAGHFVDQLLRAYKSGDLLPEEGLTEKILRKIVRARSWDEGYFDMERLREFGVTFVTGRPSFTPLQIARLGFAYAVNNFNLISPGQREALHFMGTAYESSSFEEARESSSVLFDKLRVLASSQPHWTITAQCTGAQMLSMELASLVPLEYKFLFVSADALARESIIRTDGLSGALAELRSKLESAVNLQDARQATRHAFEVCGFATLAKKIFG
jgi:hypothetical protein